MHKLLTASMAILFAIQSITYAENGYDTDFIDLVEIVYGEGYLSQGGPEMVEQMFENVELKGKTVLDLGCGIGGPALYLAKNYNVTVIGVDPEAFMIHQSQAALKQLRSDTHTSMAGSAQFLTMKDPLTLQQFPDNSFDIVTSREVILHVPHQHKLNYFREIFRVLKQGGQLVILDWQHRSPNYSDDVRIMMEMDGVPFYLMTPEEYHQTVVQAGFSHVTLDDLTDALAAHTKQDLATIKTKKNQIIKRFGKETYDYALNSWKIQGKAFQDRELLVGLIKAIRN